MRRLSAVPLVLAACLISTAALAARQDATASFQSLSVSGVAGQAALRALPDGGTLIHGTLSGLQPNGTYVVALFPTGMTCASGTTNEVVVQMQANPQGALTFNSKVTDALDKIGSLAIQLASNRSLVACAAVTP